MSIVEIAGPERVGLSEIVARYLSSIGDPRRVVVDPAERYFGAKIDDRSITPATIHGSGRPRLPRGSATSHPRDTERGPK